MAVLRSSCLQVFFTISQNLEESTCAGVLLGACNFIKTGTPPQVFTSKLWEIFTETFLAEHLWAPASKYSKIKLKVCNYSYFLMRISIKIQITGLFFKIAHNTNYHILYHELLHFLFVNNISEYTRFC